MDNQTIMVPDRPSTLLAPYGSRVEIKEFADRIKRTLWVTMRDGELRRMTDPESVMLSAASLAHGLDPFTKEIQLLLDKRGMPVIYAGPSAYEKAAVNQIKEQGGGNFWPEFEPINSEAERKELLIPQGAIAYRCKLYDTPTITTWSKAIESMSKAGAPWHEIKDALGTKPFAEGIGIYKPSAKTTSADEQWSPIERARKRAFHAALKKRFALPFVGESDGDLPPEFTGRLLQTGEDEAETGKRPEAGAQTVENKPSAAPAAAPSATTASAAPAAAPSATPGAVPMPEPPPAETDYTDPAQVRAAIDREQAAKIALEKEAARKESLKRGQQALFPADDV